MTDIKKNLDNIKDNLMSCDVGRSITLVAVSKQQELTKIIEAINWGQRIFGENYLQEALKKQEQLKEYDIEWHFIGPIQSNKCKLIAENFSWVHTIDRLKIAKRINEAREGMPPLNICIQINISRESTKSGLFIENLDSFANEIEGYNNLKLRGLMAIPSNMISDKQLTIEFGLLKDKFEKMKKKYKNVDKLSVGMSNDYMKAIRHGANMIRVGSNIFGVRK
tara:strand:+ start:131 stop:796 length:666 start_codon:yes stop_codon:yes gene_type:complete